MLSHDVSRSRELAFNAVLFFSELLAAGRHAALTSSRSRMFVSLVSSTSQRRRAAAPSTSTLSIAVPRARLHCWHTALSSSMSQIFASCVSSAPGTRREAARTSSRALTSCNRAFNAGEPRSTFPFQCPFSRSDLPFFQRAWPPAGKPRLSRAMGRPSSRASRAALCAAQTLTPYLLFRRAGSFKLQVTYSSVLPFIVHYYR
ncbi:hypothetical protein C8R47DRAFT_1137783 [Mycena vitilis]|nr:hypothetical protein C8R47DRAFT_1137783 [Mycena vitilis]